MGGIITQFFAALGGFLLRVFVAKAAIRTVGVAGLLALSTGLVAAFNGFISPWVAAVFSTQYGQFLGLLFPPVSGTVITVLVSAWAAGYAYKVKVRAVKLTAGV